MQNTHTPNAPRPTLEEAKAMLAAKGWTVSAASWENADHVYAFAQESYPGTMGGAAACVHWNSTGWLSVPPQKPRGVRFV
jgi:hypothetical protein